MESSPRQGLEFQGRVRTSGSTRSSTTSRWTARSWRCCGTRPTRREFLLWRGRFPRGRAELPDDALEHLGRQTGVPAAMFGLYDLAGAGRSGRRPVTAPVVPLRPAGDDGAAAGEALTAVSRHLDRCKLAARTVRAYKRQAAAYVAWLAANASAHGDAFADLVGAEGAVTAWKRDMLTARSSPATVHQALAAVTLMYEQAGLRIAVRRVRIPRPGEPDALTRQQEGAVRRAAARRGPRDAAIIAVLLDTGARVEECARLDAGDFAITARTGEVRLHGKGDEVRFVPLSRPARELVSAWLDVRDRHPGPAWTGQRGPLTISGITQVVLAAGDDAGIPGLHPHRCRHTFATRLRQGGADPAQVQAMLAHASIDTAARYFRAGSAENAAVIERVFND